MWRPGLHRKHTVKVILLCLSIVVIPSCVFAASSTNSRLFHQHTNHTLDSRTEAVFEPRVNVGGEGVVVLNGFLLLKKLGLLPILLPLLLPLLLYSLPLLLPLLLLLLIPVPAISTGRRRWDETPEGINLEFLQEKMANLEKDISKIAEKFRGKTVELSFSPVGTAKRPKKNYGVMRNRRNKAVYPIIATSLTLPNRTLQ